jgi:thiol:disulfide interchange protein DsbC
VPIIKNHPDALPKSRAIMCAGSDEKAIAMLEDAFQGKEIPPPDCESTVIEDNLKLLAKFNINGTPTIIFPDGNRFQGAVQADELIRMATGKEETAPQGPAGN